MWRGIGNAGINFLNILPKLGSTVIEFFGNLFTDVFNSIYNQQIDKKSARNVIVGFFVVVGFTTIIIAGFNTYRNYDFSQKKVEIKKTEIQDKKSDQKVKKEVKKPEAKSEKTLKKPESKKKKEAKKPELKVKRNNVAEVILPDLNLKTETVIQLLKM